MTSHGKIQKSPRLVGGRKTDYGHLLLKNHIYNFCTREFAKKENIFVTGNLICYEDLRDKFYGNSSTVPQSTVCVYDKVITVIDRRPSSYKALQFYQLLIDGNLRWALIKDAWLNMGIINHLSGV